jgi:hypothetical protein
VGNPGRTPMNIEQVDGQHRQAESVMTVWTDDEMRPGETFPVMYCREEKRSPLWTGRGHDDDGNRRKERGPIPALLHVMGGRDLSVPYGLPASLRRGSWRWFRSSNVIDFEQWRRRQEEQARSPGMRG